MPYWRICPVQKNSKMKTVNQDGISLSISDGKLKIKHNDSEIILTEENTDILRECLYENYRYKKGIWKKKEKKVLKTIAKHQGKEAPDKETEQYYKSLHEMLESIPEVDLNIAEVDLNIIK